VSAFRREFKPVRMGKVWLLPYDPRRLEIVLDDLLKSEKNINVLYSSKIKSCICRKGCIESARYFSSWQTASIKAGVFIDAGAGVLLQKSGATQVLRSSERQMSGFALELAGVSWDDTLSIRVPYALYQAVQREELPLYAVGQWYRPVHRKGACILS